METQLVSALVAEYVDRRFKTLMAESEAQHRNAPLAEVYMLEAWKMKNIGQEITEYLRNRGM
jgi:hypothetical protein